MTAKLCTAIAMAVAWLAAVPAQADTTTLAKAGGWEAFGGTTTKGRPVCGLSTSPAGKYFGLKFFSGEKSFTIQIGAKGWKITDGRTYKVAMRFDGKPDWNATGTGMHFNDGDPGIEYDIRRADLEDFTADFGRSKRLRILFQKKGMADWSLDLAGAQSVQDEFDNCVRKLKQT